MKPAKHNLKIYAGATFVSALEWKVGATGVDLAGATARMQVRKNVRSPTVLLLLTTENGGIKLDLDVLGAFRLEMSDEETSLLTFTTGQYHLEFELPDGTVRRLLEGTVTVSPEITR
jgi:hypothetical protein